MDPAMVGSDPGTSHIVVHEPTVAARTEGRRALYPPPSPFDVGRLQVSELHSLHYEQLGKRGGKPVVVLHGGPGAGLSSRERRFHDPEVYHIVVLDQRGAGKSTPHACLEENTTWNLVADLEKLRAHLGIERWQVFGGSWGSTLALAYAQAHPFVVTELVMYGIFLCRLTEVQWL